MRVAIRGFAEGVRLFEDLMSFEDEAEEEDLLPGLVEKHALAMTAYEMHMIEIEFLDERDPTQRFFRFGTDPRYMMRPMKVDL